MATPFVTRAQWGARPARRQAPALNAQGNTAHYGGPSPWGTAPDRSSPARFQATTNHNRCASIWRGYQAFHLDGRGWNDIAYSSGICPHGVRYEGRGPGRRTGAQGSPGNEQSHATCYIAGDGDPLTDAAKHAYLDEEARLGTLRWNHADWMSTACAGNPIRAWLRAGKPRPGNVRPPTTKPTLPPAPKDWFTMATEADLTRIVAAHTARLQASCARDARDNKVWAVGPAGRFHIANRDAYDLLVLAGAIENKPLNKVDAIDGAKFLDGIPVCATPAPPVKK